MGTRILPFVALLVACQAAAPGPTSTLEVAVAPLTLPGLGKACYDLRVTNAAVGAGDVVWSRGTPNVVDAEALCSDRYGSGGGLSYVGPCDASGEGGRINSVTLWVDSLYDTNLTRIEPNGPNGWRDPCPSGCTLEATCRENADTPIAFDLTILRDANQGFFDVAVTFDDIFCSAKVDCQDSEGPLELLFDPLTGQRRSTVVAAFACTGGPGSDVDTVLYRDALVLTCGTTVIALDPTVGRGNAYTPTNLDPNTDDAVWQYATYAGQETLNCGGQPCNKVYWNVAIGLDTAVDNCRLTTAMTASDGALDAFGTPPNTTYPFIGVDLDLTNLAGLVCTQHALNTGDEVATDYTRVDTPKTFGFSFDGSTFGAASYTCVSPCQNGGVCTGPNTCTCVGDWQGATCTELECDPGFYGAAPPLGDGVCRQCTPIANCASGLTCTTASDSTCGQCATGFVGTATCVDINACASTPCGANADCVDLAAPALGDTTGRSCTCQAGFEGNPEVGCTAIPTGCSLVQDGLVFALDANNTQSYPGTGTTWTDLVRGIDCSLNGQVAFDTVDDTMVFNGTTNTYVGCGTSAAPLSGTTQLTVSFWVKKPSADVDALVSTWTHSSRQGWFLQWFSDGSVYFGLSSGGVNNNAVAMPWTSGWRHVTGVFDGVGATAINRIYIDGVEQAAMSANQLTSLPTTAADLRIGSAVDYTSWSTASIGVVTIYNRALSAGEVLQNYQAGRSACSPRPLWDGSGSGVLDTVSGASAGYSVRALRSAWIDPLMRVRRVDNAVIDIYALANGGLDIGTLDTFAGTSDVFVGSWYDQTGLGHHATQGTTTAQPRVVAAGAVNLVNGKAAVTFDGTNDYLAANSLAPVFSGVDKPGTFFSVHKLEAPQYSELLAFGNTGNITEIFKPFSDNGAGAYYSNRRDSGGTLREHTYGATDLNQTMVGAFFSGTALSVYKNGLTELEGVDLNVGTVGLNTFSLGAIRRTSIQGYARASFQEVLVYPTDRSAVRTTLEHNLASSFGVPLGGLIVSLDAGNPASYPGTGTTWTDLSSGAHHATLVDSPTYQTPGGGTITFDGTNHATLGDVSYNRSTFSVFGWVRMNAVHSAWKVALISKWYTGDVTAGNEFSIGGLVADGPSPLGVLVQTDLGVVSVQDTVDYTVGGWVQVGFTWDHGDLRFYKNGVMVASTVTEGVIAPTTQPMALVTFYDLMAYRTQASISTVTLHNRALSAAEILQTFDTQRARFGL